jgi:general secretion pathway protein G
VAGVREGGSLASGLAQAGLFPPLLVAMAASGEASGQLGALLKVPPMRSTGVRGHLRDGAGPAGAGDHRRHGRHRGADHPVDPAADPAIANPGWTLIDGAWLLSPCFLLHRRVPNGFSLVELMVVIFILGLLTTVVLLNVMPSQDRAMAVKAQSDIATLEQALEMFRLDEGTIPRRRKGWPRCAKRRAICRCRKPGAGRLYQGLAQGPWGRPYLYRVPGEGRAVCAAVAGRRWPAGGNRAGCRYHLGPVGAPSVGGTERSWPGWPCFWEDGPVAAWRVADGRAQGRSGRHGGCSGRVSRWCRRALPVRIVRGDPGATPVQAVAAARLSAQVWAEGDGVVAALLDETRVMVATPGAGQVAGWQGRCARRWGARLMRWCLPG